MNEEILFDRPLITGVNRARIAPLYAPKFYLLDDVMLPKNSSIVTWTFNQSNARKEWACTGSYYDYDVSGDERGIP